MRDVALFRAAVRGHGVTGGKHGSGRRVLETNINPHGKTSGFVGDKECVFKRNAVKELATPCNRRVNQGQCLDNTGFSFVSGFCCRRCEDCDSTENSAVHAFDLALEGHHSTQSVSRNANLEQNAIRSIQFCSVETRGAWSARESLCIGGESIFTHSSHLLALGLGLVRKVRKKALHRVNARIQGFPALDLCDGVKRHPGCLRDFLNLRKASGVKMLQKGVENRCHVLHLTGCGKPTQHISYRLR